MQWEYEYCGQFHEERNDFLVIRITLGGER
jgi:hypothetical protein